MSAQKLEINSLQCTHFEASDGADGAQPEPPWAAARARAWWRVSIIDRGRNRCAESASVAHLTTTSGIATQTKIRHAVLVAALYTLGASSCSAVTVHAMRVFNQTTDITITYDDSNRDGLFEMNELTSFSGYGFSSGGGSSYWTELIGIPDIPGVAVASVSTAIPDSCIGRICVKGYNYQGIDGSTHDPDGINPLNWQVLFRAWSVDGTSVDPSAPVPEVGTLYYLAGGLIALFGRAAKRWRRQL